MGVSFVALCHRMYNFIVKCLATYATKCVTLGHGRVPASAQLPSTTADHPKHPRPTAQETTLEDPAECVHEEVQEMGGENNVSSAAANEQINEDEDDAAGEAEAEAHAQAQPPKKMVSINETVEEIAPAKKIKKKKGTKKMGSFDEELDEPKLPLKSILKTGSKVDENQFGV